MTATEGPRLRLLPQGGGFILGDLYPRTADAAPLATLPKLPELRDKARMLVQQAWGRYVAVLYAAGSGRTGVLRDPGGQVAALVWRLAGGIDVVTSDLQSAPSWLWPPGLALAWERIGCFLADPTANINTSLFAAVESVLPGELIELADPRVRHAVWNPADFAIPTRADPQETAAELMRRVEGAVETLTGGYDRIILELSGGLDSAILAGTLGKTAAKARVVQWLNSFSDRPEGDERAYASAVTARLGVPLTTVAKSLEPLTEAGLAELGGATWPAINGCDASRDRDEVVRIEETGAQAILSGQGGDAVFFQMPSALVVGEALAAQGPARLFSPLLPNIARRLQGSVWSVLAAVLADCQRRRPLWARPSHLASAEALRLADSATHAWVAAAFERGLPGAKQLQVSGLVTAQMLHGESRRSRLVDLTYPFLSQPVVEWCLSIPSHVLADGAFDRPYARNVFADRLPDAVRLRRSKGGLNSYHSRLIAGSLPMLRPYLLDGCLCGAGILDRDAVDAALDEDQLIWLGRPTEIFWAATVESWARHWQGRIPAPR